MMWRTRNLALLSSRNPSGGTIIEYGGAWELPGKLWYAPKGPGARTMQQATRAIEALKKYASTQGVFLLQVEPE
ncbi:hypothetical protein LRY29_01860, partial [Candidatus Saccharibacteria bacterium]|nr:hypothetical protein [Candidatus Saccharibacteria bacterium]